MSPISIPTFAREAVRCMAVSFASVILLMQAGCGGSIAPTTPPATKMRAEMRVTAEPPGPNCGNGGYRYDLGPDVDDNGLLESTEVQASTYVCPGAQTAAVLATVAVGISAECKSGAAVLRAGVDAGELDGKLQDAEASTSVTVCLDDPAPFATRLAKVAGAASLDACPYGGSMLLMGVDTNNDGVLDSKGRADPTPLCRSKRQTAEMRVLAEPPGAHCANGGYRYDLGQDLDGNGRLEDSEAQKSAYICPAAETDTVLAAMAVGTSADCKFGAAVLRAGVEAGEPDSKLQEAEATASVSVCLDYPPPFATRLAKVAGSAPVSDCPFGGSMLSTGVDTDGSGVLDRGERADPSPLCRSKRQTAEMRVLAEPPGAHCAKGGFRYDLGQDVDGNGKLDDSEAQKSTYICPAAETDTVLAAMGVGTSAECKFGAAVLRAGVDAGDHDGRLQDAEATAGVSVCLDYPPPFATRLAKTAGSAPFDACPFGGTVLSMGVDGNGNSFLDSGERDATALCRQYSPTPLTLVDAGSSPVQGKPNTQYRAVSNTQPSAIKLPQSLAVGDVVAVVGDGSAGWRIAQNAGQSINAQSTGRVAGRAWAAHEQARGWSSISSSADGRRLMATAYNAKIYLSNDAGLTWNESATNGDWTSGSMSEDGTQLVASISYGVTFGSIDAGANWTPYEPDVGGCCSAISPDGQRLVLGAAEQQFQVSSDGGKRWQGAGPALMWVSLAMSAGGKTLWAAPNDGGNTDQHLYASFDGGLTWKSQFQPSTSWVTVSASASGQTILAGEYPGSLYLSADFGKSWSNVSPQSNWWTTAVSGDGQTMLANTGDGPLYASYDGGKTWASSPVPPNNGWLSLAISADGTRMAVSLRDDQIYTSSTWTTIGTTGSLSGSAGSGVLLQYLGKGNFTVLKHFGTVSVQ